MARCLSDRALLDWLSSRAYVEATDFGEEDPNRFQYPENVKRFPLREALSDHIRKMETVR